MVFTIQEVDVFSHRIENCLDNAECKEIFKDYLQTRNRNDLLQIVSLWEKAEFDLQNNDYTNDYESIIEEIDGFTEGPLSSNYPDSTKLEWIKRECARILDVIKSQFIDYLKQYHM